MFSANRSAGRSRLPSLESSRHRSASVGLLSRDSYGIPRRTSSEERKSGNGTNRRWSGMRNSLSNNELKGVTKETRPLTDKTYQKKKTGEIVEFLEAHNFKPSLSQSKLMQPSKKEFEMIFRFLVNFWEPSFVVKCLEEDAPRVLKNLGYPFIPNKSVFTHVARTNFSSLLGILIYLVDFAKFTLHIDLSRLFASGDCDRPEEHDVLLNYIFECYHSGGDDREMDYLSFFEKTILKRNGDNFSELQEENVKRNESLNKVKNEVAELEQLQIDLQMLDSRIKQYEEYLLEMKKRKEKKEAHLSKSSEDLKQKMADLNELEEQVNSKQAIYDAQGFDGKKHLSHHEEQKRELNEALLKKKATLRELQDECWDLEMQQTVIMDKGTALCEEFNRMYARIEDAWKTFSSSLQNIRVPEVQNIVNNSRLVIPEGQAQNNQRTLLAWSNTHREALEEIQNTVTTTNVLLKTTISHMSEELMEIEMKKSQLSTKLKCASSEESQKEHDVDNFERQAVEEIKCLEKVCDEKLENLNKMRKESAAKQETISKLKSDLQTIEHLKLKKTVTLETYLKHQKKYFERLFSDLETITKDTEQIGEEIVLAVEEMVKNKDV